MDSLARRSYQYEHPGQDWHASLMTQMLPGDPLSDDELRTLADLVARYTHHHLDQWEFWKVEMPYGSHYVCLSAGGPLWEEQSDRVDWQKYVTIWPPRETPVSQAGIPQRGR